MVTLVASSTCRLRNGFPELPKGLWNKNGRKICFEAQWTWKALIGKNYFKRPSQQLRFWAMEHPAKIFLCLLESMIAVDISMFMATNIRNRRKWSDKKSDASMHGLSYRNIAFIKFLLCGSKAIYYLKANPIKRKQQLPDCTDCNKHQVYQQLPNILLKKSVLWI